MLRRLLRSPGSRCVVILAVILLGLAGLLRAQQTPPFVYAYDDAGRLVGVVDATGHTTTYTYDALGNIVSIARGSAAVSILAFSPRSGPVGTSVTIVGAGFSATAAQNTVTFNGVPATVVSATPNRLVAVVPAEATTGPIHVTSPSGSAVSAMPFTVGSNGAPTISGFTPTIGTAGNVVTITGTNFEPVPGNNKVAFNGHLGPVVSATATTLEAMVPATAVSGRITVTTPNGRATSPGEFFVPPSSFTAGDVEVTGRMGIGETHDVTISQAGKLGLIVFDGAAGQRISLKIDLDAGLSGSCVSVSIHRPDGLELMGLTFVCGSSRFIEPQVLPVSGTYLIALYAYSAGTATLTLYDVPPDASATIAPGGPPVAVTITTPGQNAQVSFIGGISAVSELFNDGFESGDLSAWATVGQRLSLLVSFGAGLYPTFACNTLSIQNPDGTPLLGETFACGSSYFSDVVALAMTGPHTITLNPRDVNAGTATLTLYAVPADVKRTITVGGPAAAVTATAPGQNAAITFSGVAGQVVTIPMTGNTIGLITVIVWTPDGNLQMATLTSETSFNLPQQTLPVTGTYTIFIDPYENGTGSINVAVTSP